jgi:hypothetical protein
MLAARAPMLLFGCVAAATVDPAENKFVLDSMRIPDPIISGPIYFRSKPKI